MGSMIYKGYSGTVEYSEDDDCLFGRVAGIRDIVTYEGQSVTELRTTFQNSVDDYLEHCQEEGKEPTRINAWNTISKFAKDKLKFDSDIEIRWERLLDDDTWTGEDGIYLLVLGNEEHPIKKRNMFENIARIYAKKGHIEGKELHEVILDAVILGKENSCLILEYVDLISMYGKARKILDPVTPFEFISWAKSKKSIKVPKAMIDWHCARSELCSQETNDSDSINIDSRRRNSYILTIAALCSALGKKPDDRGLATKLKNELEFLDEKISDDTIRGILKEVHTVIEEKQR